MKKTLRYALQTVFAILLLHTSSSALAFTIIEIPDSNTATSASITDSTTFNTQMQPLIGALQSHLVDARRGAGSRKSAQSGDVLAINSHNPSMSDVGFIEVSSHGDGAGGTRTLWLNTTSSTFSNDFSGTKHNGDQHMLLAGYDFTFTDSYVFGIAISFESSNINTEFNLGNQETDGFSINPYFAYLISDSWSLDLSLGYGQFETDQYRTPTPLIIPATVDSNFDSTRDFIASNLSYAGISGNWYVTGWFGLLLANKDQDSYRESNATAVDGQSLDMELWSLGVEAAYGYDRAESYFGLVYEVDNDLDEIEFSSGDQPANDDDSMLLSLGWRYYGSDIVANIEFGTRLGADDAAENSISSTLRIDL